MTLRRVCASGGVRFLLAESPGPTSSPPGVAAAVQSTWLSLPGLMGRKYTPRAAVRGCLRSAAGSRSSGRTPIVGRYLPLVTRHHQGMYPVECAPVAGGTAGAERAQQWLQGLAFEDAIGAPHVRGVLSDMDFLPAPAAGGECLECRQCFRVGSHGHQQAGWVVGDLVQRIAGDDAGDVLVG